MFHVDDREVEAANASARNVASDGALDDERTEGKPSAAFFDPARGPG
jgi:hypothetical protein